MSYLYFIDLFGTFVFAISGILTAVEKKFDVVGAFILGLVTAIGGGTLRDILIGATPVGWMTDFNYLLMVLIALPFCYFLRASIQKFRKGFFLFDTLGIAVFTLLGLNKTLSLGLSPAIAVLMGVTSAVVGGVLRDVLTNEVPLIFRKEIYALACLAGSVCFLLLQMLSPFELINISLSILMVIIIRILSVKRKWSVPFNPN